MNRTERIVVLAWSVWDALAGSWGSRDPRALMPTRRVVCPSCGGEKGSADRFSRWVPCGTCDYGDGRGPQGRVWVDGYTDQRTGAPGSVTPLADAPEHRVRVGCQWCQESDRGRWDEVRGTWVSFGRRFDVLPRGTGMRGGERCSACDGSGWRWLPLELFVEPGERSSAAADRVAWRIAGSYAELVRSLEALRGTDRVAYRAFMGEAQRGVWPWPAGDGRAARGLAFLGELMPERVHVAGDVIAAWRARHERARQVRGPRRDEQIRRLVNVEGKSPKEVSVLAGVSERRVRMIAYGA